jgi:hypothetical protein
MKTSAHDTDELSRESVQYCTSLKIVKNWQYEDRTSGDRFWRPFAWWLKAISRTCRNSLKRFPSGQVRFVVVNVLKHARGIVRSRDDEYQTLSFYEEEMRLSCHTRRLLRRNNHCLNTNEARGLRKALHLSAGVRC